VILPLRRLKNVVLPAPFGPMMVCRVCALIVMLTPSTALSPPKAFTRFRVSRMVESSIAIVKRGRRYPPPSSILHETRLVAAIRVGINERAGRLGFLGLEFLLQFDELEIGIGRVGHADEVEIL